MIEFPFKNALTPLARRLALGLLGFAVLLGVLHALTRQLNVSAFWERLFNLDAEFTFGAMVTATLFLGVSLVGLANAILTAGLKVWQRFFWGLLALLFTYLSLDEYFVIHENILAPVPGATGPWIVIYTIGAVILAGGLAAAYWFGFRRERGTFAVLAAGLTVMGLGGLGVEAANFFLFCDSSFVTRSPIRGRFCHRFTGLEESIELMGISIVLAAFLSYAHTHLDGKAWRLTWRAVVGALAVWMGTLMGTIWVLPGVEARLLAQSVEASYADGALSLVGYRVSRDVLAPDGDLSLSLYWRAEESLGTEYFVSAHLVTRPEAESVAQGDRPLGGHSGWRTTTWQAGVVMKDRLQFDLPKALDTPASYWLILRVWWPTEYVKTGLVFDSIEYVPVEETDRSLLTSDTLILFSIPALSPDPQVSVPDSATTANYRFEDGFSLVGYTLPETGTPGELLPLVFWWSTQDDVDIDLVQFVHLLHANGEGLTTHDQPPFGDSFPSSDWPADMAARDAFGVPLPEDLPLGAYRVQTGMYVLETGDRRAVTDSSGQPVTDNSIYLGTIVVE